MSLAKQRNKSMSVTFEDELKKLVLEVQHEIHISDDPKVIDYRRTQLQKLIRTSKKFLLSKKKNIGVFHNRPTKSQLVISHSKSLDN